MCEGVEGAGVRGTCKPTLGRVPIPQVTRQSNERVSDPRAGKKARREPGEGVQRETTPCLASPAPKQPCLPHTRPFEDRCPARRMPFKKRATSIRFSIRNSAMPKGGGEGGDSGKQASDGCFPSSPKSCFPASPAPPSPGVCLSASPLA